jgi:hypothetical protein
MCDNNRFALDAAAVADLLDLGIDEQIQVAALELELALALAEGLDLFVEQPGDPRHLAPADPQPQRLDELVDPPRADAADIGLLDDGDQRLLGSLSGLQKAREVAALTDLGDLQLDLTRPRVPAPRPIAIVMRRPILGALTALGANEISRPSMGVRARISRPGTPADDPGRRRPRCASLPRCPTHAPQHTQCPALSATATRATGACAAQRRRDACRQPARAA